MLALLILLLFLLNHQAEQQTTVYLLPVTGNATVTIYKDGKLLKSKAVNSTKGGSVKYKKTNAQFSDSGQYNCEFKDKNNSKRKGENINVLEPVSQPKLSSNTTTTAIGHNVTLSCLSNGSLPIYYTFFRQKTALSNQTCNESKPAELTVHIKSTDDRGPYKCKAVNRLPSSTQKYSQAVNLTISEKSSSYTTMTVSIVVAVLLIVIALSLALAILILPKCKAQGSRADPGNDKPKSLLTSEPDFVHDTATEVQYTTVVFKDPETVATKNDASVEYDEILVKNHYQKGQCRSALS
ncbi:allergin-1 [Microcaecilia unicolor]|uniref:Allergin-1 n=1 Tax=Microcaecilia unicolor TaxID=1415580 RepID=A0A6P7Y5C3_9AMPH|nr:allergin-1 [Microcaecilia unicolor]